MGDHLNTKKDPSKHHKRGYSEGVDVVTQRKSKASFKNYLQDLEDDLLEDELAASEEWIIEQLVGDKWIPVEGYSSSNMDWLEHQANMLEHKNQGETYRVTLG